MTDIIGFNGPPRSGKTAAVATLGLWYWKRGYTLLSNFPFYDLNKGRPYPLPCRYKLVEPKDLMEMLKRAIDYEGWTPLYPKHVFCGQELQSWLESRIGHDKAVLMMGYWVLYSGKMGVSVVYDTQLNSSVDKRLKENASYRYEAEKCPDRFRYWELDLATSSTTVVIENLPTPDSSPYNFSFASSGLLLTEGEWYCFVLEGVGFIDSTNAVNIYGLTSGTYYGYMGKYISTGWATMGTGNYDPAFFVYGDLDLVVPTASPAPLPTGGLDIDISDADAVMEALIGYGVPVVVMLLPMIFIWLVGGRGKWPMLLGITIGTGVGYLFGLVPPWLVFLISIGVVGFAYQSVRSGN